MAISRMSLTVSRIRHTGFNALLGCASAVQPGALDKPLGARDVPTRKPLIRLLEQ